MNFRKRGQNTNHFEISFQTTEKNGLLIWLNKGPTIKSDFLAVAIVGGHVELSYNLGKEVEMLRLRSKVSVFL